MDMIQVTDLRKVFTSPKIEPGFGGAVKSLFHREYEEKVAVDGISFSIARGEIVGYLGPNGAGKSTTIKMITGILTPTAGSCRVDGIIPYEDRIANARNIGVVFGQRTQLWWDLPLTETFSILRKMYRVPQKTWDERLGHLREVLGLDEFMSRPVRTLSLGQRMRADLAAAMVHAPKVLYLDEPTIGLDIVVKDQIRQAIRDFRDETGMTVMLTTHDMGDIEELCPRILVIDKGRLIYDGSIDYLRATWGTTRDLQLAVREGQTVDLDALRERLRADEEGMDISLLNRTVVIRHDVTKTDTVNLIPRALALVPSADIRIVETPVADIIKRIYRGMYAGSAARDAAAAASART